MLRFYPQFIQLIKNLGLQVKLTIMVFLLSVLPLITLGVLAIETSKAVVINLSNRHVTTLLGEKRQYVRTVLEQAESLIANISGQEALKVILNRPFETMGDFDKLSAQAGIGSILSGYINLKGLVSIDVISPGGGTFHVGDTLDSNQLKVDLIQDLLMRTQKSSSVVLWSGIEENINARSSFPKVFMAVKRLEARENDVSKTSLLVVSFDPEILNQGNNSDNEDFIMILDDRSRVVAAPNRSTWGESAPKEILSGILTKAENFNFSLLGKSYKVNTQDLDKGGWKILYFTSLDALSQATNSITLGTLGFLLGAFGIVFFISRWISKDVVKPIRKITQSFSELQNNQTQPKHFQVESLDEIGDLVRWYNTFLDAYSAKRKAEEDLKELNRTLEHRVDMEVAAGREKDTMLIQQSRQASMGEMIGNIAHQWRQPLNTAALLVQDMQMSFEDGILDKESVRDFSDRMLGVIDKMSSTIDDFRDFFKPNKAITDFSVEDSVKTCISFVESGFKNRDIQIHIEAKDPGTIRGYPNEFSQVLINILNNAKDILIEKNPPIKVVRIWMGTLKGRQVITITDSGGGVPPDIIEKVFDPYFTTKGPAEGTGIGLFMSRTIIERNMGGTLSVQNQSFDKGLFGAQFTITVGP